MITDGREVPPETTIHVDVCIVGGGVAGIALARELIGTPGITVALIESGGRKWDERTQDLSAAQASGHPYFPVKETHLRVLGGSSLSYGGVCSELSELQFEERPWVPGSGWPFSKNELKPYVSRAYRLFETDGVDGQDHLASSENTKWKEVRFSPPTRFGHKYAGDLARAANVTTYLHSTVTHIQAHPDGEHVDAVQVSTFRGNRFRVVARSYVLAGGGIEIPRLMLASHDVVSAGIGNRHDNVGRYFQEHPRVFDRYRVPVGTAALTRRISGASGTLRFSRLGLSDRVQRAEGLLDYHVNLSFGFAGQDTPQWPAVRRIINARRSPWSDSPYFQDVGGGPNTVRWKDVTAAAAMPHRTVQSLVGATLRPGFMRRWLELESSIEQAPRRENRVVLSTARDELGLPRAELHWTLDDRERRTYRRGRELILEELERLEPGLSSHRMDDPEPWPDHVIGTWHHCGTTRMHNDPVHGVVDANAKVHGIDNLFITGSAVFPTSGAAGPTLTIACLALRLKDHLTTKLRQPTMAVQNLEPSGHPLATPAATSPAARPAPAGHESPTA